MKYLLILMMWVTVSGCTQPATGRSDAAAVVIDVTVILQRNPDIKALHDEEKDFVERRNAIVKEAQALQQEMKANLDKIADKTTLSYKDKESSYRRRLDEYTKRLDSMQLTMARRFSSTTDKAYRAMMAVALKVARRKGASIVLPRSELPDPHFNLQQGENVIKVIRAYEMALADRVVIAATEKADITAEVIRDLGW